MGSFQGTACVFLDRDGVLIAERGTYTYKESDIEVLDGVAEALGLLKVSGYRLVVITNQGGLALGLYTVAQMEACHAYIQAHTGHHIDAFYYSPDHPFFGGSLTRKPKPYLFKQALADHPNIQLSMSWMVGDSARDLIPARQLGIRTIQVGPKSPIVSADYRTNDLLSAVKQVILAPQKAS